MFVIHDDAIPSEDIEECSPVNDVVRLSRTEYEALVARAEGLANGGDHPRPKSDGDTKGGGLDPGRLDKQREDQLTRELAARDARLAALEETCKAAVRDRELATLLSGRLLVTGGAAQLIRLWKDEFDVYEEDGLYKVAARDGRAVSQVVADWLSSSDYAHFCLPNSRGGTGARDTTRPISSGREAEAPKNLGEAIVMKWREESASQSNRPMKTIGLKRQR